MKKKVVITAVVLLVASFVSIASALQIDVDGDPSDWVPAASVATSPPIPNTIYPGSDIAEVFFTNDTNNFYWRIDTYAPPQWNLSANQVFLQICMNTDNNINTGAPSLSGCNVSPTGNFGFDYLIFIRANGTPTPSIETYVCSDCDTHGSLAQVASVGTVTEIGIPISDLNLSSCTSGSDCVIPTTVYSTQYALLVDWVPAPDQTFNVYVPGPTAVSLNTFSATSMITNLTIWLLLGIMVILAVSLYVFYHKRFNVHFRSSTSRRS
ncbi:MAG: hypothetical protein M5U34_19770 [Chloroflexi bacterium]|nr:hypothetical protein [Chloroflexota bacterium]